MSNFKIQGGLVHPLQWRFLGLGGSSSGVARVWAARGGLWIWRPRSP